MKKEVSILGFTLLEALLSLVLFCFLVVGMIGVFVYTIRISSYSEMNSFLYENVTNVMGVLNEGVRKEGILGISSHTFDSCDFESLDGSLYKQGSKLCLKNGDEYYLGYLVGGDWVRVNDKDYCRGDKGDCSILRNGYPLTNSMVGVQSLQFYSSDSFVSKVTIVFTMKPLIKGVAFGTNGFEEMKLQTTVSQRSF